MTTLEPNVSILIESPQVGNAAIISSHAHLQCVHNNCAKFEECQHKGVREVDYTK
jgi:hypothetical protein